MDTLCIWIGGFYHLAFVIFHMMFWKMFNWKETLKPLSSLNRAVMQVLNIHLTYFFLIIVIISFFYINDMVNTGLGKALTFAISIFWFLRAVNQILFFGFKKAISVILCIIFLIGGILYLLPVM
jgi:hypothetical protein